MTLCEHITNNQSNFKFVPILNKIEEHIIAPCLAFAWIFQLKGYGQYIMHGSIINVPTNLDFDTNYIISIVVWWLFICSIFEKN
jgi:hypothetical protein